VQVPESIKQVVRRVPLYRRARREYELNRLRRRVRAARPLFVVIGGGGTHFEGWVSTDRELLDITRPADWRRLFAPDSIDRLLSEHVFEHLSEEECRAAFAECYRYLKPGGFMRLAVPDGYRRDPDYVAEVSPPRDGHKSLFTVDSLAGLLAGAGFRVEPLEYFDAGDVFRYRPWDETEGYIARSARFNHDEPFRRGEVCFTSLIADAHKD
jgi:predicted SAM-dependent methyltransferase